MCGIVGMVVKPANGFVKQHEDCFYQLLYADALRGEDSTGVIGVENDTSFHIAKEATEAAWFSALLQNSTLAKTMWATGKAFIGHNRKKTVGAIKDETAHPFVVDDVFAMVHNGTLYNHQALANTEVDSEALAKVFAKALGETDYIQAMEEILGKVNGAYATASYDQRTNKVHLLRNSQRPMSYVETSNAWYFASEAPMLFWILARNGYQANDLNIQQLAENTLVSFDLDKNKMTEELLVPKKFLPPSQTIGKGATTTALTKQKGVDGLSKSAYKRFRNKHIFTTLEFWGEDFIETNYPLTLADGETAITLMGSSDHISLDHLISAEIDLKEVNLSSEDLTERLWAGRIADMSYDSKSKKVTITISNAYPLPVSFHKGKGQVIDAEYIRRKLDEEEKATSATLH
ncbi:Gn_AT_II domain containing protein [uncultured Caudovirales phage]|uniref:Gn_AT_II domain containing protein n=1 Tax=uncultured Caudovirales phage TaxID=2100421 RepID=A0A6J5LDU7_9CAUD|nr:Gn_AT_II domain containing protein [uncultured Caudovirales phage]